MRLVSFLAVPARERPQPTALDPNVEAYLEDLRVTRRLAPNTLDGYQRDLSKLLRFTVDRDRHLRDLTRADLEAHVREQMGSGLSPRSVARSVASVRGLFRFLVREGELDSDPANELRAPRAWPSLPKCLSCDEVDRLLDEPDTSTSLGLRDRALIELLYATGMRVSELVGVRPNDLNLGAGYLTCLGKGSKERLVPIGRTATEWVARYNQDARPLLARGSSPWVFVNARGGPLSRVGFWKILKKYASRANLPRDLSPHVLRSTPVGPTPALVRHAPPRARSGSPLHPGVARSRRPDDYPDLHAHPRGTAEGGLRRVSPAALVTTLGLTHPPTFATVSWI